jgi:hypothetical protein
LLPALLALAVLALAPASAQAQRVEKVTFFQGTQYPLTAWFIKGDEPGPTIMVQGGIQGDEKAGFVTAQLLTKARVRKGQLIVVPRANVPSINVSQRQVNVDLNRRFDKKYNRFYEDRLALAIRFLVSKATAFIHLHEGSGFYHPTYVDDLRNPLRYGQSIIIDTMVFENRINLAEAVSQVLSELNPTVVPAQYKFQLFNTQTFDSNTPYPEMRKTLTCYALENVGIPAMAVEVSKNIKQLGWKVRHQLTATALLLTRFGVNISPPEVEELDVDGYARRAGRIELNGQLLSDGDVLRLQPNTVLAPCSPSAGNDPFAPSLAVCASDRPEFNLLTSPRMALSPFSSLEVRSDGDAVARVKVRWQGAWPEAPTPDTPLFACWINDQLRLVPAGGTVNAVAGDQFVLEGVLGGGPDEVLNFKGYVAKPYSNDGQDMGTEIILDPDNFLKRYLESGPQEGVWRCRVVRETKGKPTSSFQVRIAPRKPRALKLEGPGGRTVLVPFRDEIRRDLAPGTWRLTDVWCNGSPDKLLPTLGAKPLDFHAAFDLHPGEVRRLGLRQATTFQPLGEIELAGRASRMVEAPHKVKRKVLTPGASRAAELRRGVSPWLSLSVLP